MKTPTLGSMPELLPTEPMPRMRMTVPRVSVTGLIFRLGTYCWSWPNFVVPESSRKLASRAAIEIATSWSDSSRLVAVT